jgi:hypothetical protein
MFKKSKVLVNGNMKIAQKKRAIKGDRRPARNCKFVDERFSYMRGSVYNGEQYWIFANDNTADDVRISEEDFKEWTGKLKAKEIKITAKSNKSGGLIDIKKIEIIT